MAKKIESLKKLEVLNKAKQSASFFRSEFRKQLVTAITAAFAFVIALVWNDAIKELVMAIVNSIGIQAQNVYLYKIYTAIAVTIICVIAIILFSRWSTKQQS
ncbi:MAG: DUF5654 family protein [Candidatus Pacearchaeota archaeon]